MTIEEPEALRRRPVEAVERHGATVVMRLAGELDLYNAAEVGEALAQAGGSGTDLLVVDLTGVEFVDSTALGALVEARRGLVDTQLVLAAPAPEVRRALDVSGLATHFDVRETVEAALATAT
jgi:anti-sigma B factor antagonist